ncbi:MAG: hypothetical protein ACTTHM_04685 [Peptoanaerobacter stomatis]|uniref:hypothetical protein n=1 Tax=Peptoanaerobacter stomatis TaxID=796937 RepID=UPI003FA090AC
MDNRNGSDMMSIAKLIEKSINNNISQLNTMMLCKVIQVIPHIELISYFDAYYIDGTNIARTKIIEPLTLEGATYKVGDIVLTGFLQEYVEDGAVRKFDISDAVIIGKVKI